MAERRVTWNIGARIDRFEKSLKTAERRMLRFSRDLNNIGRGFTRHVTMPAMAAGGALLGLTHQAASYADEIDKASIRSGVARDSLQQLRYVGDQLGVSFTGMTSVMESFTRRIPQIREGTGRSAEAFSRLGVSLEDSGGNMRSMNQLFPDLIRGLSGIRNETERNALGTQIFGRRFFEIVPMLEAGGDEIERLMQRARDLGLVMGDDAISDLVAFKDEWAEVQQQLKMAGMEIGREVMPLLRDDLIPFVRDQAVPAVRQFANWIRNLDDNTKRNIVRWTAYAAAIGPVMVGMSSMTRFLVNMSGLLRMQIGLVRTLTAAMMKNPWTLAATAVVALGVHIFRTNQRLREQRDLLHQVLNMDATGTDQELQQVQQALLNTQRQIEDTKRQHEMMGVTGTEAAQKQIRALKDERDAIIAKLQEVGKAVIERRKEAGAMKDQEAELRKLIQGMEEAVDIHKELTERPGKPFIEELLGDPDILDGGMDLDFDTSPAEGSIAYLEMQVRAMNEQIRTTTDEAWRSNLITIRNATQEQIHLLQNVEEQAQETGRSLVDWAGMGAQAFDRLVFQGERFSSTLKSIGRQLATRGMMALLTGGTGGLGMLAGGGFLAGFAGMFATGGRIPSGQWGIAGEAGPEIITGPANVTPMVNLPSSKPAIHVTIDNHMNLDGRLVWRNQREVQYSKGR